GGGAAPAAAHPAGPGSAGVVEVADRAPGTLPGRAGAPQPDPTGDPSPRPPGPARAAPRVGGAAGDSRPRCPARGEAGAGAAGPSRVRAAESRSDRAVAPAWAPG